MEQVQSTKTLIRQNANSQPRLSLTMRLKNNNSCLIEIGGPSY